VVVPQKAWRCPEVETVGMRWGDTSFAGEGRLFAVETRRPRNNGDYCKELGEEASRLPNTPFARTYPDDMQGDQSVFDSS
jgi:hypothetical protein